ncbi:MAG: serine/threonine protein kinase, partial [Candidatus Hydrogenedentota bacterium]
MLNRRNFLKFGVASPLVALAGCNTLNSSSLKTSLSQKRFFFTSQGKTTMMNGDGSGSRYLEFDAPGQATWQPGAFFSDGRALILSMEPRRDG